MSRRTEYFFEQVVSLFINIISLGYLGFVYRGTHKEMLLQDSRCKRICKIPYSEFKKKFIKIDWVYDPTFPKSLFTDVVDTAYWHADILRIADVGYLLTTYGFIRSWFLKRDILRKVSTGEKYDRISFSDN